MAVAWERCVREVTLSADPGTVGSLSGGWHNLGIALEHLRDALVGRTFVGPVAPGTTRPGATGLTDLLASWQGTGGDAYRDHLNKLGTEIEELVTYAMNVKGALSRITEDIETAVASIPIPLLDDWGWKEWSLPNGTELDSASDGRNADGFLRALRQDYQSDPSAYDDGAFRDRADDLEATMKIDGAGSGQKRGGWWDTQSHLDNWYSDNQQAANAGMSPLPAAVEAERPKLVVPPPSTMMSGGIEDDTSRVPPIGVNPDGRNPSIGSMPDSATLPKTGSTSISDPAIAKPPGFADSYTPQPRSPEDYGSGLAGVGDGGGYRGPSGGLGGGPGSLGGIGGGASGAGGGAGAVGGLGAGAVPGLVAGGAGKRPPLTSAGNALRAAMAEGGRGSAPGAMGGGLGGHGGGQGARGGAPAGMGMMGGGGGLGAQGAGASEEHKSWLVEDDDPWGAGGDAPPGVLR
ncbi:MAG TPA: hypothetical protein VFX61_22670 [Micromonosporaceae bacterium]|nr:hypothetical protein [Micromonosporaceae bacterium]